MKATDPQFAPNPLPVIEAMARALAELHLDESPSKMQARTPHDVANAHVYLLKGRISPAPYDQISDEVLIEALLQSDWSDAPHVFTHGAPTVANATIEDGEAFLEGDESMGFDPVERDLAIVLRSIAETFSPEATRTFLDAYEEAGGSLPNGRLLDWYALLAAFRDR